MKNGECPKCSSQGVYVSVRGPGIAPDHLVWYMVSTDGMTHLRRDAKTLVCTNCGYWENYVWDEGYLAEIVQRDGGSGWAKVVPADWMPDPTGRHELRFWDGIGWTSSVSDEGVSSHDPIGA